MPEEELAVVLPEEELAVVLPEEEVAVVLLADDEEEEAEEDPLADDVLLAEDEVAVTGEPEEEAAVVLAVELAVDAVVAPEEEDAAVADPEAVPAVAVDWVEPLVVATVELALELELLLPSCVQAAAMSATTARVRRVIFRVHSSRVEAANLAFTRGRTAVL